MKKLLTATCLLALLSGLAWAKPMMDDTVDVPTDRMIANLERKVAGSPTQPQWHYELARVEAIAYAQQSDTVKAGRKDPDTLFHGRGDVSSSPPQYVKKPVAAGAREHLERAVVEYGAAVKLDAKSIPYRLGYAWCLDQAGQKTEAIKQYRIVYKAALAKESATQSWDPFDTCFACETAGYLIPLLDAHQDAAEIAAMQAESKRLDSLPRAVTPILIPLDSTAQFEDLVSPTVHVRYDLDGSGVLRSWQWITPRAGWLVYDGRASGQANNGLRLIGSRTFWVFWDNGYDALSALDDNGDGLLTGDELKGLAIWHDANGNGICDPGEVQPLSSYGIVSLSCHAQSHSGGFQYNPQGVTFDTGEVRATYDWISTGTP